MRAHHALAPIAQIGVRLARADSGPMSPAAGAFFVRRFRYRNFQTFLLYEIYLANNENLRQQFGL